MPGLDSREFIYRRNCFLSTFLNLIRDYNQSNSPCLSFLTWDIFYFSHRRGGLHLRQTGFYSGSSPAPTVCSVCPAHFLLPIASSLKHDSLIAVGTMRGTVQVLLISIFCCLLCISRLLVLSALNQWLQPLNSFFNDPVQRPTIKLCVVNDVKECRFQWLKLAYKISATDVLRVLCIRLG